MNSDTFVGNTTIKFSKEECKQIGEFVHRKFGITLSEDKEALISSRLHKIFKKERFNSFDEFYQAVVADTTGELLGLLIDHFSTNHTFFYRENEHFNFFSNKVLPNIVNRLKQQHQRQMRIWCAGCSSGEEAYTLAILILEFLGNQARDWEIAILATDISNKVLEIASSGIYEDANISRLPDHWRSKYFQKLNSSQWRVNQSLKDLIMFRRLNLMRKNFPFKQTFQSIFCRNVMIYFNENDRAELVNRFHRFTAPGGYFFIGHSESLRRGDSPYNYVAPAIYQRGA